MRRFPSLVKRVVISWKGLPLYAATAINAAIKRGRNEIHVIATTPDVPATGIEETLGAPVSWITEDSRHTFRDLGVPVPDVMFTAGWSVPAFMRLARQARNAGSMVVCMADNSFRGDVRQYFGAIGYRALYRHLFDAVWVPGQSAAQLMKFYGVPRSSIYEGLYTCDTSTFRTFRAIHERPLAFTFVGQMCNRKNVVGLCEAFLTFLAQNRNEYTLDLFGSGPLRKRLPRHPALRVHDFATPDRLAAAFNESRCLVLPSLLDHWGVVVHEAASCGMLLIVSDTTGSSLEMCSASNSRIIRAGNAEDLVDALHWAANLPKESLVNASQRSQVLASRYSTIQWADTFHRICESLSAQ